MSDRTMYQGTIEYLDVAVASDVELTGTVEISFDRDTWHEATWTGDVGTTRTARILLGDTVPLPDRSRNVYVRFTDTPEIPVIVAGRLVILT